MQAIDMIASFGGELDEGLLLDYLRREDAVDAYDTLRALAESDEPITKDVLVRELERLSKR